MKKDYSVVVFFKGTKIAYQKRHKITDLGERKYAFWGGKIQEGETKEEALERELKEELNLRISNYTFWKSFIFKENNIDICLNVFLSPLGKKILNAQISEGDSIITNEISEAIKSKGFHKGDLKILIELKKYLRDSVLKSCL